MSCDSCKLSDYPIFTQLEIENRNISTKSFQLDLAKENLFGQLENWQNYDYTTFNIK